MHKCKSRERQVVISGMGIITPQASKPDELINWSSSQPIEDDGQGDWFDAKHYLGKRGHRYFTPATKYLLAASGEEG